MKMLCLSLSAFFIASVAPAHVEELSASAGGPYRVGARVSGVETQEDTPQPVVSTFYAHPGAINRTAEVLAYQQLWDWVRDELGDIPSSRPPPVVVVTPEVVHRIRNGPEANVAIVLETVAVYDRFAERIFLSAQPDLFDPASQSILIHELVHHAQSVAGRRFACPAAKEQEAYRVQSQWLHRSGTDLEEAFGIDALTLKVITACGM